MELNFTEINKINTDINSNNNFKYNSLNNDTKNEIINKKVSFNTNNTYSTYWDPKPEYEKIEPTKNQVSYDDILNSMNMVLINGRLHFVPSNKSNIQQNQQYNQIQNINNKNNHNQNNQNYNHNQNDFNNKNNKTNNNSYIYNKYFKNFQEEEVQNDVPQEPLTPEEIKRNIIINRLKQIEQRKRIEQIKSKKLLFDTSNINISHQNNNPPNLNKLFRFPLR